VDHIAYVLTYPTRTGQELEFTVKSAQKHTLEKGHGVLRQLSFHTDWIALLDDKFFWIYAAGSGKLIYQSEIVFPTSVAVGMWLDPAEARLWIGSEAGQVRGYQISYTAKKSVSNTKNAANTDLAGVTVRMIISLDLAPWIQRIFQLDRSDTERTDSAADLTLEVKTYPTILSIEFTSNVMWIVSPQVICVLHPLSFQLLEYIDFNQTNVPISTIRKCDLVLLRDPQRVRMLCSAMFRLQSYWLHISEIPEVIPVQDAIMTPRYSSYGGWKAMLGQITGQTLLSDALVPLLKFIRNPSSEANALSSWDRNLILSVGAQLLAHKYTIMQDLFNLNSAQWGTLVSELPLGVGLVLKQLINDVQVKLAAHAPGDLDQPLEFTVRKVEALQINSPLRKYGWEKSAKPAIKSSIDRPIMFHKSIKSSGYTHAPFLPKHLRPKMDAPKKAMDRRSVVNLADGWLRQMEQDELGSGRPLSSFTALPSALTAAQYCPLGSHIAVGCQQGSLKVIALKGNKQDLSCSSKPINLGEGISYLHWAHHGRYIVANTRRQVHVWDWNSKEDRIGWISWPRPWDVVQAMFFYQSKFIIMGEGNQLRLVRFRESCFAPRKSDATPNRTDATTNFLSVWAWESGAKSITCIGAPNEIQSPLVIVGTSDRGLHVLDVDHQQVCTSRTLPSQELESIQGHAQAQARPYYSIRVPDAPWAASAGSCAAHLFVTTAPGDLVKLWDVRTMSVAMRFGAPLSAPKGRSVNSGASLSPCGTMIIVPTENPSAVIFDVRKGLLASQLALSAFPSGLKQGNGSAHNSMKAGGGLISSMDFCPTRAEFMGATTHGNCVLYSCTSN
jgi:WD40 repeat protein